MPTMDQHQSGAFTKLIYIGDSSTGKTGSLASLVDAGYKFKIIDMDNGLEPLKHFVADKSLLRNIEYETYRDNYKGTAAGPIISGQPKAFTQALAKMTEWQALEDAKTIFVLDSLSAFGRAAYAWADFANPTVKDKRQIFGAAQAALENTIALLTAETFRMNVIIISHVKYDDAVDGVAKGYVSSIGKALGPIIPRYFNTLVLAETSGAGNNVKRKIKTVPTGVIDLKTASPKIDRELPLETGMATIFDLLKTEVK